MRASHPLSPQALSWVYTGLMQAVGASHKVFEFMDREPELRHDAGTRRPEVLRGRVRFDHVTFGYPSRKDDPVLKVSWVGEVCVCVCVCLCV